MSFNRHALSDAVLRHGAVWRVVVAETRGSTPREVGASMLVWRDAVTGQFGQSGTIGGGTLEYRAAQEAPRTGAWRMVRRALGPELGQCCGGAVTLLTERWDAARLEALPTGPICARGPEGSAAPLAVVRLLADARAGRLGDARPELVQGWMVEPVEPARQPVWIYGAGHVGRALAAMLAPLPGFDITLIDIHAARFPAQLPEGVTPLVAAAPGPALARAPDMARHLIMTHSHELDLEICHLLLTAGASRIGLIGSATKRARFNSRLRHLGHSDGAIASITCPIGDPGLGKHPQAIAVGVASDLLRDKGENRKWATG